MQFDASLFVKQNALDVVVDKDYGVVQGMVQDRDNILEEINELAESIIAN